MDDTARPLLGRILFGTLVLAVVVFALYTDARRERPTVRLTKSGPPAAVPALVEAGSDIEYRTDDAKDFVLRVGLRNYNHGAVQVQVRPPARQPAFPRVAAAVSFDVQPTYQSVAAQASQPVRLPGNGQAYLVIAGRIACDVAMTDQTSVTMVVDGQAVTATLPRIGEDGWAKGVRGLSC